MRNSKRVRFFRRLIYILIVILLFLPLVLTSYLSIRLISRIEGVEQRLSELELKAAAVPAAALPVAPFEDRESALDDGLTAGLSSENLTPETQTDDETAPDYTDDPVPEEDGDPQVPLELEPADKAPPSPEADYATSSVLQPAPLTGR
jgi:hypothetical protein